MMRHLAQHSRIVWWIVIGIAVFAARTEAVASSASEGNIWFQSFRLWDPQTRMWDEARGRAAITLVRDGETLSHHECELRDSRMELRIPVVDRECVAILRAWSPEEEFAPYAQAYGYGTFESVEGPRLLIDPQQVEVSLYPTHTVPARSMVKGTSFPFKQVRAFLNTVPRASTWNGFHVVTPASTVRRVGFSWMHADTANTYADLGEQGIGGVQFLLDKAVSRFSIFVALGDDGALGPQLIGMEDRYAGIRWELRELASGVTVAEGTREEIDAIHVENLGDAKRYALLYFGIPIETGFAAEGECAPQRDNSLPDCQCESTFGCHWTVVVLDSFCHGLPGENLPPDPVNAGATSMAASFCYAFSTSTETSVEFGGELSVVLPLSWSGGLKLGGKYTGKTSKGQTETRCVTHTLSPGWSTVLYVKESWCDYECRGCMRAFGALWPDCNTCEREQEGYVSWSFPRVEFPPDIEPFAKALRCDSFGELTPAETGNGRLYRYECD